MDHTLSKSLPVESYQLFDNQQCESAIHQMAEEISDYFLNKPKPLILCVMMGGLVTTGKLLTQIKIPIDLDYIHGSRYLGKSSPSQQLQWFYQPRTSLDNRLVLVIDDILDEGITMQEIYNYCYKQGAKNVQSAVLINKPAKRSPKGLSQPDFYGLETGDHFVFGYGMDYHHSFRNVPAIYACKEP